MKSDPGHCGVVRRGSLWSWLPGGPRFPAEEGPRGGKAGRSMLENKGGWVGPPGGGIEAAGACGGKKGGSPPVIPVPGG